MKALNSTISAIEPSVTLAISSQAAALRKQGVQVCTFAAGEPDFDTPECIRRACQKALDEGKTRYTPVAGIPELREAIAEKLLSFNHIDYSPSQILVSCGGKHSLALAFQTLLCPGDEVIIPAPYWLSYPQMVRIAGGTPKFISAGWEQNFKITPQQLEEAIGPKTKALVLNNPSNPTGMVYTPEELKALANVALKHDLWIVSDEIYERMVYGTAKFASVASFGPEYHERTITVSGMSKTYAMTGWRLGYTAAPQPFIKAMTALQSHTASAPTTFSQWGGVAALQEAEPDVQKMVSAFAARRERIVELMQAIPGVHCPKPEGAFYIFANVAEFGLDSVSFCSKLLVEQQVAAVPGLAFGNDNCIRLSYACSMENIEAGLARIAEFCASLQR
ncbi:MAG: pyridoxal phosphate-dependent aminotransferase [Kiritimatiellia bacterium]